jgi:hypothetical protein
MHNVISFRTVRTARLKDSLSTLAARREGAIVRERSGRPICACRIFCRDQGVVLIDRYGFQSRLGYDDILDATPTVRVRARTSQPGSRASRLAIMRVEDRAGEKRAEEKRDSNVIAFPRPALTPSWWRCPRPAEE